jgi:hypothetical protein
MTCSVVLAAVGKGKAGWPVVPIVDEREIFALLLHPD